MRVLAGPVRYEWVVQKSRFLGCLEPVTSPEAARTLIKEAKGLYADATHVVHAFRTGFEGSETLGCSDDGEPPGTAGRPVLEVLKGAGGHQSLLLVVRWFGGIKLGTGGLVKAYTETAQAVIASAPWTEYRAEVRATITVPWADLRALQKELKEASASVETEDFAEDATLVARIPADAFAEVQARTVDLTRGKARWTLVDTDPGLKASQTPGLRRPDLSSK